MFGLNNVLVGLMAVCAVRFYVEQSVLERELLKRETRQKLRDAKIALRLARRNPNKLVRPTKKEEDDDEAAEAPEVQDPAPPATPQSLLRLAHVGAFVYGLAMTNQHTTVFYVLPTAVFVVASLYK